jgi:hypothetical protein
MRALLLSFLLSQDLVSGDATIRAGAGTSEIVIRTTSRLAGAIDSLRFGGKEFINSADHGRQLQSASNLDCGTPIMAETYNPTEAGSRDDGAGPRSSSLLVRMRAEGAVLETTSKMAFWLRPGERSGKNLAKNTTALSEHLLSKKVTIGFRNLPQVVEYVATFTLPAGERHTQAVFEAVTGYMPPEFSRFLAYDAATREPRPLTDGPGEQAQPVIFSTESGSHAMGIYSPEAGPGYGRFRFVPEQVVKWNCVFRVTNKDGIPPGEFRYRTYIPVGKLEEVVASLGQLHELFGERK